MLSWDCKIFGTKGIWILGKDWITVQKSPQLIPARKYVTMLHGGPCGEQYSYINMLLFQPAKLVSNYNVLLVSSRQGYHFWHLKKPQKNTKSTIKSIRLNGKPWYNKDTPRAPGKGMEIHTHLVPWITICLLSPSLAPFRFVDTLWRLLCMAIMTKCQNRSCFFSKALYRNNNKNV